jgi:hypothetical protein
LKTGPRGIDEILKIVVIPGITALRVKGYIAREA